jgi:hypothetical protein
MICGVLFGRLVCTTVHCESNDGERLLDAVEELRVFLASSVAATARTKPRPRSVRYVATRIWDGSLRILCDSFLAKQLRDATITRWTRYRLRYRQKRNVFLLLTLSGALRPATLELSYSDGGQRHDGRRAQGGPSHPRRRVEHPLSC